MAARERSRGEVVERDPRRTVRSQPRTVDAARIRKDMLGPRREYLVSQLSSVAEVGGRGRELEGHGDVAYEEVRRQRDADRARGLVTGRDGGDRAVETEGRAVAR